MHAIDVDRFLTDGFAKVEAIVPRDVADQARALLWRRIGLSPDDPSTWTQPVVWTADLTGQGPFGEFMRSPRLHAALNAVAGEGGWHPRTSLGNIPVRFPVSPPADDRGWHVDHNTQRPDHTWGVSGRPHTLLLLVLFSEVSEADAPTRIRAGSHRDLAPLLDETVFDPMQAGPLFDETGKNRPVVLATGLPGDAYVVHPFTVHAAQEHLGTEPRFMAQMPIILKRPLSPGDDTPLGRAAGW
ncbi:phytanoyl-CoA dioxygenase family protein [Sphaerisporangium sp. B11E5]|uniref:phytanoyl-CoA dioxygenase family protein n=1 Tax=Sphaerisporangium sp. B11E5 TaxID=3153563 RepID=UPI00325C3E94